MATIEKKVWPEFFEDIEKGTKKFELRLGDMQCQVGDTLLLREWDPKTKEYSGRQVEKKVTYARVFKIDELFWPKKDIEEKGLLLISLE